MKKITEDVNVYPTKYLLKRVIDSLNEMWDILEKIKIDETEKINED